VDNDFRGHNAPVMVRRPLNRDKILNFKIGERQRLFLAPDFCIGSGMDGDAVKPHLKQKPVRSHLNNMSIEPSFCVEVGWMANGSEYDHEQANESPTAETEVSQHAHLLQ
jgi:hypothetical protein